MTSLLKYTSNFRASEPIFHLQLSENRNTISISEPINKFQPTPIEGDILSEIVCDSFEETFSKWDHCFHYDNNSIAKSAMRKIRNHIAIFLEKNLPLKNPRQSKLYRWAYRSMPTSNEFNDGLVLIYKYIRLHSNEDLLIDSKHKVHLENAIALLDAMKEKYGEEE